MFYKQETFLSTISDTNPLLSVVGKCSVLDPNQYIHSRATQYNEPDVYICESIYDESKRQIKANPTGRKQYEYSTSVQTDEIYLFKNPISVQKVCFVFNMRKVRIVY